VKTQQARNPIPALKVPDVNLTAHSMQNIICGARRSSATCRSWGERAACPAPCLAQSLSRPPSLPVAPKAG
jgi:hypothetical protein